jgi:hypothetical protein
MADDRTVIVETPRSGGGSGWIIALVLVAALVVGIVFFTQISRTQASRDQAITNAANNVGQAAREAGKAAQDAANTRGDSSK